MKSLFINDNILVKVEFFYAKDEIAMQDYTYLLFIPFQP